MHLGCFSGLNTGRQARGDPHNTGARVTHVCCTGEGETRSEDVARCSLVPHVVEDPTEVIGDVDAVVVATDIGADQLALKDFFYSFKAQLGAFVEIEGPSEKQVGRVLAALGLEDTEHISASYVSMLAEKLQEQG